MKIRVAVLKFQHTDGLTTGRLAEANGCIFATFIYERARKVIKVWTGRIDMM
jgi:hypothetical protein